MKCLSLAPGTFPDVLNLFKNSSSLEAIELIFVYNFFVVEKTYIIVGVEEGGNLVGLMLVFLFNWDYCRQG